MIVTRGSFHLMAQWQSNGQKAKLPQTRRKVDKSAMGEASQISAMVAPLSREMCTIFPIDLAKMEDVFVGPFRKGADTNLVVALQGLLHTKPTCDVQDMLPLFQEMVAVQKKDADISLTGVAKTELIQNDIDKAEFALFFQKFLADMQALGVHQRKTRTKGNEKDNEADDVEEAGVRMMRMAMRWMMGDQGVGV